MKSFLSLALIFTSNLMCFFLAFFIIQMLSIGLFDTSSNIFEYDSTKTKSFIIAWVVIGLWIASLLLLTQHKVKRMITILPLAIFGVVLIVDFFSHKEIRTFDKEKWNQTQDDKFIQARSLILNKSLLGKDKKTIRLDLGEPTSIEENIFKYWVHDIGEWQLLLYFDTCCVEKVELIAEPYTL